jgi:ribosomal protein S18 acetylase RimI-like enzyme
MLSLLVFADNITAQNVYGQNGFRVINEIERKQNKLIPHDGGCILMSSDI